jgi:hypothetical protein
MIEMVKNGKKNSHILLFPEHLLFRTGFEGEDGSVIEIFSLACLPLRENFRSYSVGFCNS